MKRKFISIHLLLMMVSFICLATACLYKNNTGRIILSNSAGQLITHARIEICNQIIEMNGIKPDEDFTATFDIRGDSHYKIVVFFASGKEIEDELGYVTQGFDFTHTIIVTDSEISISDTKIE